MRHPKNVDARKDAYHFFYKYNDRGRGDSVFAMVNTGKSGLIMKVMIDGVDYFKNNHHEKIDVKGDFAITNVNDEHTAKYFNHEIYAGQHCPRFAESEIEYLLKQKEMKATVIGGGSLQLMTLIEKNVCKWKKSKIVLVRIILPYTTMH